MKRKLCIVFSACLVAFGQAAFHPVIALVAGIVGYALFWVVFVKLERWRILSAFSYGAFIAAVQLFWLANPTYQGALIVVAYILLIAALGGIFAAFAHFITEERLRSIHGCLAFAGLWTLIEWARLFFLCGYAWNPAGLALGANLMSAQLASIAGVLGLTFAVMAINFLGTRAILCKKYTAWAFAAVLPFIFGFFHMRKTDGESLRTLVIQTGLFPYEKYLFEEHIDQFVPIKEQWNRALSMIAPVDLIVFPESAFPGGANRRVMRQIDVQELFIKHLGQKPGKIHAFWTNSDIAQEICNILGCEIVIGLDNEKFNAAFHFVPGGEPTFFAKQRLLPIAETIPFDWLKSLALRYGIEDSFLPGTRMGASHGKVPLTVSVCYDECFSKIIRDGRKSGAELLINVTNDAWYPHSRLGASQFEHGRLRAIENGAPLVRSCNTGVSAGLDCFGRCLASLNHENPGSLLIDLPLYNYKSLYVDIGDFPLILLSVVLNVTFLLRCLKKRKSGRLVESL